MEGPNIAALRKALTSIAHTREMRLDPVEIEALARAAAQATTWMDEAQMLEATGRAQNRSLGDWCRSYGVPRHYMARRQDVLRGLRSMPGRGRRRDLQLDDEDRPA